MLLGEPPRSQGDLKFRLLGIPIRVHPLFWLVAVLLGPIRQQRPDIVAILLIWVGVVFVSILVHEMGHAMVQRAYGFRPWITLYGMGGLASYEESDGYGARGSPTVRQILISLAGPGAGFLLVVLVLLVVGLLGHRIVFFPFGISWPVLDFDPNLTGRADNVVWCLLWVNIMWGVFNLLPIYPLDGGQISRELFLLASPSNGIRNSLVLSIISAAGVAVLAVIQWKFYFMALFFGFMAYESYTALQAYSGRRRPW